MIKIKIKRKPLFIIIDDILYNIIDNIGETIYSNIRSGKLKGKPKHILLKIFNKISKILYLFRNLKNRRDERKDYKKNAYKFYKNYKNYNSYKEYLMGEYKLFCEIEHKEHIDSLTGGTIAHHYFDFIFKQEMDPVLNLKF